MNGQWTGVGAADVKNPGGSGGADPAWGASAPTEAERDRLDDQRCRIEQILAEGRVSAEMATALRARLGEVYLRLWAMAGR
jgi:hypothetical protein